MENADEIKTETSHAEEEIGVEDVESVPVDKDGVALEEGPAPAATPAPDHEARLRESREEYLRLYADFDNYKKRVAKDKEELLKYSNESLMYEVLPSLDNLDIALKHLGEPGAEAGKANSLAEGVQLAQRELLRTLQKFGLDPIEAQGRPFDPELHHAIAQVEREDLEEGLVVEDFRRGYKYKDKLLRASMVSVSKKTVKQDA